LDGPRRKSSLKKKHSLARGKDDTTKTKERDRREALRGRVIR